MTIMPLRASPSADGFERRMLKRQRAAERGPQDGYVRDRHGRRMPAHPAPSQVAAAGGKGGARAAGAARAPLDPAEAERQRLLGEAHRGREWKEAEAGFEDGMRTNALEYIAADEDTSGALDFREFCNLVCALEEGDIPLTELKARFAELDANKNGTIDRHEFIQYSLYESLARSAGRVVDLFKKIDGDGSNTVDKKEFRKAIRALGFSPDFYLNADVDAVFDALDEDGGGSLDLLELTKKLKPSTVATNKFRLRKKTEGRRGQALASHVKLVSSADKSATQQLAEVLAANRVRIIDLFRSWDEDGDGLISKKEFGRAMGVLGFDAPKAAVDGLFGEWDKDGSGVLEFKELTKILQHGPKAAPAPAPAPVGPPIVIAKSVAISEALDALRAGATSRLSQLSSLGTRLSSLEMQAQAKKEYAQVSHAALLQRQLLNAMRTPSVLTKPPASSARGPPKTPLVPLEGYLTRPITARDPPPPGALLRPASPRA